MLNAPHSHLSPKGGKVGMGSEGNHSGLDEAIVACRIGKIATSGQVMDNSGPLCAGPYGAYIHNVQQRILTGAAKSRG